jgi:hypothetical protein
MRCTPLSENTKPSIGFTGTRYGMTPEQFRVVGTLLHGARLAHHGECVGADHDFHHLAGHYRIPTVVHPPTDKKLHIRCEAYAPAEIRAELPYLDRNRRIVDETDRLIATPAEDEEQQRGGTWYTVRYARSAGKPVAIVWPNGTIG